MRDNLDLKTYQRLLEDRLREIKDGRQAKQEEQATVELDQSKVGRLSRMDAMQQQAMARATAARQELEEKRIRSALSRIRSGDYGYCVKCEEEIAEGRLKVDPATPVCIGCAQDAERR